MRLHGCECARADALASAQMGSVHAMDAKGFGETI